jgi:hypothetical protein
MMDVRPDRRIKDPALLEVLKFEYDESELSGETGTLALHHVILRSKRGDDLRENIVCVTSKEHVLYHAADPEMRAAMGALVRDVRLDVAHYITRKLGGPGALAAWLSRHDS